ncbi:hypothetical protein ABTY61_37655 [Kitasatospora sp. NPDC096128]|uniref:hypothetical protein n=1 Tax=Kitasatospora sp. NPDC096128 TaxID=3155547 RepID=UPI003323F38A
MNHPELYTPAPDSDTAALTAVLATDDDSLAWAALLCGPGSSKDIAAAQNLAQDHVERAHNGLMHRTGASTRANLTASYTAAGLIRSHNLPALWADPRELDWADQALLRLLARLTVAETATELALSPVTVTRRLERLLARLDRMTLHEATAHAARMHLVRPWDVRPELPLTPPAVAEPLRHAVEAITTAWTRSPRVCAQIPRGEQAAVAAAATHAHTGSGARVLFVTAYGPAWDLAMHAWTAARARFGTVVGLQTPAQLRLAGDVARRWPVTCSARGLLDLAGTRQAATVVATPEALPLIVALHQREAPPVRWDVLAVGDAHRIGHARSPGQDVHDDRVLPATARLSLTSTSPDRLPAAAGSLAVRRTVAEAAAQGQARAHWLLATAPPPSSRRGTLADLAVLILEASRLHGLRRIHVVCQRAHQCRKLTRALALAVDALPERRRPSSLWARELTPTMPAEEREHILRQFARSHESVLVLTSCAPLAAPGADALIVLDSHQVEETAEAIEWALDPFSPPPARPLVVLAPLTDLPGNGGAEQASRFAGIVRAATLLDPTLAQLVADHPTGSPAPWLETGPHLSAGDRQLVDAVARDLARDET